MAKRKLHLKAEAAVDVEKKVIPVSIESPFRHLPRIEVKKIAKKDKK